MLDGLGANADAIFAAERFAADFKQNPGKFWLFGGRHKTGSARGIREIFNSRRAIRQTKVATKIKKVSETPLPFCSRTFYAQLSSSAGGATDNNPRFQL
jgi:hypothetical protein